MPTLQQVLRAKHYKRKPTDTKSSSQWDGSTTKGTNDQGCQRHQILIQNLSPSTYGWKDEPSHEYLGRNLSPSTYGWKDEPSHSLVPWSKFKSFYLRVEGRTKPRVPWSKFKSFYLWVEGRTKSLTSALVKI